MLKGDDFGLINSVHQRLPDVPIIILAWSRTIIDFYSAFRSGIRGYLIKGRTSGNLINAIKSVNGGEVVISLQIAADIIKELGLLAKYRDPARLDDGIRLGKQEKEVLMLVSQGLTNREIATNLFISEHTVKQHMRNIMGKLHAHTRQQAVAPATEKRLLSGTTGLS